MKHIGRCTGAVLGLFILSAAAAAGESDLAAAGVVRIQDDFVAMFLIPTGPRAAILIDAGYDPNGKALLAALAGRGLAPSDVEAVFVTHLHADHVGALALLPAAKVYAFTPRAALAEAGVDAARVRTPGDGETVTVAGTAVRAYAVPGHTADGAAYLVGDVLFLGDAATRDEGATLRAAPWIFAGEAQRRDEAKDNVKALARLYDRLRGRGAAPRIVAMAHSAAVAGFEALARAE